MLDMFVRVKLIHGKINDAFEKILAFRGSPFSWKHFKLCISLLNILYDVLLFLSSDTYIG